MQRSQTVRRVFSTLAAAGMAISLVTSGASAQPPRNPPPPPPGDPALRGPEVRDRNVPGVEGSFGEPGGERRKFIGETRLPPRVFRDAMDAILSPDAPADIRVSDEQRARFENWLDDFQSSQREYQKQHADELKQLRQKAGLPADGRRPNAPGQPRQGGGGGGGGPDGQPRPPQGPGDEMRPPADDKETAAARERLGAIMQGAPKIEDVYTKVWAELRPEQQRAVDARIQEFRARQSKEREENYVRQRMNKQGKDGQPPQPPQPGGDNAQPRRRPNAAPPGPDGAPTTPGASGFAPQARRNGPSGDDGNAPRIVPEKRDRLLRIFSQLTPEQQDQLLQRLEQRLRGDDGGGTPPPQGRPGGRFGPQGPGERRPAPEPDDSMMPKPARGQPPSEQP